MTVVTVLLSACSKEQSEPVSDTGGVKGGITFELTAKDDHQIVVPVKSTVDESLVPPLDSFKIEIFDPEGVRIYRDKYENVKSQTIYLNGGDHKLLASHGQPLGVGFNAIYFAVETPFSIKGQDIVPVSAVAKMANVKISVNFGENLKAGYTDYYARVKCPAKTKNYLQFSKNETRAGYIPAGDLVFELYALIEGEWKYYPVKPVTYNPNEYVTFNVDTDPKEMDMTVNVIVDNTVDVIEKDFNIPAEALPDGLPVISRSGSFDAEGNFKFIQGKDYEGTQIDILAEAGIKNCFVEITSDYYTSLGLPAKVDLVTAEAPGQDILEKSGIRWIKGMAGQHLGAISFSGLSKKVTFDTDKTFSANVKVTVVDNNDKIVSSICNLVILPEITFTPQAYNAFAKRVMGLSAEVVSGNPALAGLQWSQDKKIWNDATVQGVSGKTVNFNPITGLMPATTYYFRTIYNKDTDMTSEPFGLTTETDLQVGNSKFEEWKTEVFSYETAFSSGTVDWYLPFSSQESAWWAVNSKRTMRSYCESGFAGIGTNFNIKNFPTVSYYNDGSDKSVQIATVATGKAATSNGPGTVEVTKVAGEFWIGTAKDEGRDWSNGDGEHLTEGHAFESRPTAVSFNYQYFPYNNENFYVYVELKDKDGVSIFSKEITDGPAENTGKEMRIPIEYNDITRKAATIYMSFKSSSAQDPDYHKTNIMMPNGDQTACVGSVLRIDDVNMIYE